MLLCSYRAPELAVRYRILAHCKHREISRICLNGVLELLSGRVVALRDIENFQLVRFLHLKGNPIVFSSDSGLV
jgi:hypothetical protein